MSSTRRAFLAGLGAFALMGRHKRPKKTTVVTAPKLVTTNPLAGHPVTATAGSWSGPGTTVRSWEYEDA